MTDPAPTAAPPLIDLTVEVHLRHDHSKGDSPEHPLVTAFFVVVAEGRRCNGWHVADDDSHVTLFCDDPSTGRRTIGKIQATHLAPATFDALLAISEAWTTGVPLGSPLMRRTALEWLAASGMVRGEYVKRLAMLDGALVEQTVLS